MLWLFLLALAADPEPDCTSRKHGLSECVDVKREGEKVSCAAVCYYGKRDDAGTYSRVVKALEADVAACKGQLKVKCEALQCAPSDR